MDDPDYEEEKSFDKELFNKNTGEKLSISFNGNQLKMKKRNATLYKQKF